MSFSTFLLNLEVRLEQLRQILDLLVVAAGFYGSWSSPEMVSIRSETFLGSRFRPGSFVKEVNRETLVATISN